MADECCDSGRSVWLFYPNLIGYGRIGLALLSMWCMQNAPLCALLAYFLSAGLDAFDGWAARTYNQSSRFGAMLDQLTDRCALLSLVMMVAVVQPSWAFSLQISAVLDIASHWLHLHANDLAGGLSHKQSSNPLLHLYYTNRLFLGFMCAGNEAFYLLLYAGAFWPGPALFSIPLTYYLAALAAPVAFVKSVISLVHLGTAAAHVVEYDEKQRRKAAAKTFVGAKQD